MTIPKLALTFEEAAEACGYSVRTLKDQVARGNLLARYANTKGVIRVEDLAQWLDDLPAEPKGGHRAVSTLEDDDKGLPPLHTPGGEDSISNQDGHASPAVLSALPPEADVEWLTPEDLARAWQVSPGTIANWRSSNKGPEFRRIGGLVRYHRDAVQAWINAQPTD
ncbi:putative DNA-binding transcriptional regulator AlpA [Arthrobacter sp. UYNi723]